MRNDKKQKSSRLNREGSDEHGAMRRLWSIAKKWPLSGRTTGFSILLLGTTAAIIFNAVVLQPARHPAPLFAVVDAARAVSERQPVTAPRNTVAPVPATKRENISEKSSVDEQQSTKVDRAAPERIQEKAERPVEKADKPATKQPLTTASIPAKSATKPAVADPLGEFIRAGAVPPAAIPSEPDNRLTNIQKNLARLGYFAGKPDGLMGPATRAAIEKFERARKWPVTGEISQALLREFGTLAAKRD